MPSEFEDRGGQIDDEQLFKNLLELDSERLVELVGKREDIRPKDEEIAEKEKDDEYGVRKAWREIFKWLIYAIGISACIVIIALCMAILFAGTVYVRLKLGSPEGTHELVTDGLGMVGVAAVTLIIQMGTKRFTK